MTILLDVDGVCADLLTEWVRRYNVDWNDGLCCEDVKEWDLDLAVKPECGKEIYGYLEHHDLYDDIQPLPGAVAGVNALRAAGHDVVFVTSSNDVTAGQKNRWLVRHGFSPKGGHMRDVIHASRKGMIRGHVLVDDYPLNLGEMVDCQGVLFDAPYNRDCQDYVRAGSWEDVPGLIELVTAPLWR